MMVTTNCETSTAGCCFPIEAGLTGLVQTRPTFYCVYSIYRFYSDCDIKRSVNVDHHSRCPNHPPSWGGSPPPDPKLETETIFCSPKQDKLQVKLEFDSQALIYKAPHDKSIKSCYIKYSQVDVCSLQDTSQCTLKQLQTIWHMSMVVTWDVNE